MIMPKRLDIFGLREIPQHRRSQSSRGMISGQLPPTLLWNFMETVCMRKALRPERPDPAGGGRLCEDAADYHNAWL